MKKLGIWCMIALLLSALYLPGVVWFFAEDALTGENTENRTLAEKPEFTLADYDTFPSAYEDYYNDHLPFRSQLITLNSMISREIFQTSTHDKVVYGKDGWLFYLTDGDGDALSAWRGENRLSDEQLQACAENLLMTRDALAAQGIEFILYIAPNKERIYSEYVPAYMGEKAETDAVLQLVDYLRAHTDIRVVWPYEELMAAKTTLNAPLYFPTDTHWNQIGGYIGTRALMRELGVDMPELTADMVTRTDSRPGDLSQMVSMPGTSGHSANYVVRMPEGATYTAADTGRMILSKAKSGLAMEQELFICRDSFYSAMEPYLLPYFSRASVVHIDQYADALVDEKAPDIFVWETCERYAVSRLSMPRYGASVEETVTLPDVPMTDAMEWNHVYVDACNGESVFGNTVQWNESAGTYAFSGWAIDPVGGAAASRLLVQVGDRFYEAEYGGSRPDVAEAYENPAYERCAFSFALNASVLTDVEEILLHVISADGSYRYEPVACYIMRDE